MKLALPSWTLLLAGAAAAHNSTSSPSNYFGGQDVDPYLRWVESTQDDYPTRIFVPSSADPDQGAAVHWRTDGDYLALGIAVRATGWLGFGLTVNGTVDCWSPLYLYQCLSHSLIIFHSLFITSIRHSQVA